MTRESHEITRADLMPVDVYQAQRDSQRIRMREVKKHRRVEVGPFATFYFENYDTMLMQIQEMLYIEKGGDEQIADELAAYNPLVPKGRELVATLMFEITDPARRTRELERLGGVEHATSISFAGETITGVSEEDVERTTEAGKASSVQFLHFPFTDAQCDKFRAAGTEVVLGIGHPNYAHMAVMPEAVRQALGADFD
jgi:hypothetical protein